MVGIAPEMPIKGPLLSRQARAWAEIGNRARARELMLLAEPLVENVLLNERPSLYADYGASYRRSGTTGPRAAFTDRP